MRLHKAFGISTILLGLFPVLKLNHFSIVMMLWFVLAIVLAVKHKTVSFTKKNVLILAILSFCSLMYLVYLPFTADFKELSKQIIKSLPFLIFPLGFLWNKELISKSIVSWILRLFVSSVVLLNVLGWIKVFNYGFIKAWHENDFYHPLFRSFFSDATSLHLPYLGLFTAFSCVLLFYNQLNRSVFRVLDSVLIVFLGLSMYIYSARMAIISLIVACLYLFFKRIKNNYVKYSSLILVPCLVFLVLWISPLKERYLNAFDTEMILPHAGQQPHEVNYRYGIWYCALENIKQNVIFGVTPDQAQKKLNECYNQFDYESYEDFTKVVYNSHNQYLDQTLKFGVLGLLLFVFCFGYFIPNSSVIYQTFGIIVGLSFLTENYLDRQMGVVFIALFNTIFVIYNLAKREKSISS